jgi:hypothetical protein
MNMAQDLGYPPSWGDPAQLPAFGGTLANATWRKLGVASRPNVGGFPCEIVHGGLQQKWGLGNSCTGNAVIRIAVAFVEAMALYLPVRYNFKDCIIIAILIISVVRSISYLFSSLAQVPSYASIASSCRLFFMPAVAQHFYLHLFRRAGMVSASRARFYLRVCSLGSHTTSGTVLMAV